MRDTVNIGGQAYRVEVNFNSISGWLVSTGRSDLNALSRLSDLSLEDFRSLLYYAAKEGARLDGVPFGLSVEDAGTISVSELGRFIRIYTVQVSPATTPEDDKKKDAPLKSGQ